MTELLLSLAALALGPFLYEVSRAKRATYAFFDGIVLVGVGGLVLAEILPATFQALGIMALPVAIAGFFFPHFVEHRLGSLPVSPRTILSSLIVAGLIIHQLLDGAALQTPGAAAGHTHTLSALGIAIILHQVPKGFLLWELARKARGIAAAACVIAGLLAATAAGYFLGAGVLGLLAHSAVLYFQAFVAGGLLHVVVHHVSAGAEGQPGSRLAFWSGAGALAAVAFFVWSPEGSLLEPLHAAESGVRAAFLDLVVESAAPVLLGFLVAGILQAFVPAGSLRWFRGANRLSEALRGVAVGLPLPICSCGVTPIYHTLVRRGVPAAAAIAFLIATPELGVDSFFLSLRLLGWKITLLRLGMAFAVAVLAALLLSRVMAGGRGERELPDEPLKDLPRRGFLDNARHAVRFGFGELVDQVGVWLLAGLLVAALVGPYLEADVFANLPRGLDVPLFALLGLPIYVCASGATPLAAALLAKSVSPGAILAFLITGPTTNVTTFGVLSRLHGPARAAALPAAVFVLSVAAGWGVNAVLGAEAFMARPLPAAHEHGAFDLASAWLLTLLIALSVLRLGPRRFLWKLAEDSGLDSLGHRHAHGQEHGHGPEEGHCGPDLCGTHTPVDSEHEFAQDPAGRPQAGDRG